DADRELADEAVVRARVPEHPAAAVHVQDRRQRAGGVRRGDDADADVADGGRHGDPALRGRQLVDRLRLHVVEHLPRLAGRQLVDERGCGGRLDECPRRGLEDDGRWGCNGHDQVLFTAVYRATDWLSQSSKRLGAMCASPTGVSEWSSSTVPKY